MMKKVLFTLIIGILFLTNMNSQTLVSTDVQNKNVVLEEFTGIHCGYCPEGHAISQAIQDDDPGKVVLINIHTGGYATPNEGEPDFRTSFGDAIAGQSNLTGYPSGTVNRHLYTDLASNGGTAMGRGGWTAASSRILQEVSPVNVGASTSYNSSTRELTVNVELYYTGNSATNSNFINVALLQSNILGPQTNGGLGNNYVHKHMLRHLLTDQWGDEITTTTEGTFIQKTYTYTIPADYNGVDCIVENCSIAVFVTETHQEILSGTEVQAIDGTTLIIASMPEPTNTVLLGNSTSTSTFNLSFTSAIDGDSDFKFTISKLNAPSGWTNSFSIDDNLYTSTGTITLTGGVAMPLTIDISPNENAGFIKYTLKAESLSNPNAPALIQNVYVIANTKTLLVHNQGSWAGGTPSDFQQDYFDAFIYAGATNFTSSDYKGFMLAASQNKLSEIQNIFFNIAWTFPGFTNENVTYFSNFLDNGGNLFVAGQDVGWDTWDTSNGGNGTTETQSFYTNYLNADFQADGGTSNNSVNPNVNDDDYAEMGTSSITNIYGGMYPDEIDAIDNGQTIMYYNNNVTKSCAIKSFNGTYKTIYLGFDPSMMSDEAVKNELLKTTYNWFTGNIPAFARITPTNESIDIDINTNITIKFSQSVKNIGGSEITNENVANLITFKETDASGIDVDFTATIDPNKYEIIITPTSNLEGSQNYFVEVASVENINSLASEVKNATFTTKSTVSINNLSKNINIYPNPAQDFITINVPTNSRIDILDISGKVLISKIISNDNQRINIKELNSGIYLMNINSNNNTFKTKFVVK